MGLRQPLLTVLVILCLGSLALAQPTVEWTTALSWDLLVKRVFLSPDGDVVVAGNHAQQFYGDPDAALVEFVSPYGNVIGSYESEPHSFLSDAACTPDGAVVLSMCQDEDYYVVTPSLRKITAGGGVLWDVPLPDGDNDEYNIAAGIAVLPDSSMLVSSGGYSTWWLSRVSPDGELVWSVPHEYHRVDMTTTLPDGRVLLVNNGGVLIVVSPDAELLAGPLGVGVVQAVSMLSGGHLALTYIQNNAAELLVLTPELEPYGQMTISDEYPDLRGLAMAVDGDFIVAGTSDDPPGALRGFEAWMSKVGRLGEERWAVTIDTSGDYYGDWFDVFSGVVALDDGGVVAVHTSDDGQSGGQRMVRAIRYATDLETPSLRAHLLPLNYPFQVTPDQPMVRVAIAIDAVLAQQRTGLVQLRLHSPTGNVLPMQAVPVTVGPVSRLQLSPVEFVDVDSYPPGTWQIQLHGGPTLTQTVVLDTLSLVKQVDE